MRRPYWYLIAGMLFVVFVGAVGLFAIQPNLPVSTSPTDIPIPSGPVSLRATTASMVSSDKYLAQVTFAPSAAKYFDQVNSAFQLTSDELALLKQNGFVVTDRLAFTDFRRAYAYIYFKDLPVVVTTDSILQSIHQAYDDILVHVEISVLSPKLMAMLDRLRRQIHATRSTNPNAELSTISGDLETYVTVPLALLTGNTYDAPGTADYVSAALRANDVRSVQLFGSERRIDFTLFTPRGHYAKDERLQRYFRAMTWLGQIDFRLVEYDANGKPHLNRAHLAAAVFLRQMLSETGQRQIWTEIDNLFSVLVGRSDNVSLSGLDQFLNDAHIGSVGDVLNPANAGQLLNLLTENDYGKQRSAGQPAYVNQGSDQPAAQAISFMLFGPRYAVDSYVMSSLTFDRLVIDGKKVQRPYPSPLDVMYALGNDRALIHLQTQLAQYDYQKPLKVLREAVDNYPPDYWTSSVYNRWLGMLRALNQPTTGTAYPQSMRTAAWSDKMLSTNLASWAELRHDNVLYVKQSFTGEPLCEYPAGYVEPYPAFYAAVQEYARAGRAAFNQLSRPDVSNDLGVKEIQDETFERVPVYFDHLDSVANTLKGMAEKELRLEPFTSEEEQFLKGIVVYKAKDNICTIVEQWDGWYSNLFPWGEDSPALVTDVHTNLNHDPSFPDLLPPGVLQVATGSVALDIFIADTDQGPTMYEGPAFTYYELLESGYPPKRLTDEQWRDRLNKQHLAAPDWSASFRVVPVDKPQYLYLPRPTREIPTPSAGTKK